ncbi:MULTISPECIES: type II toxin-antitoxin system VapC family toxin [unclassified Caballeronia]|uniref:type II toxin-antitoxin system VapC family toxin n=1 Tax=unclassified Caballeronia TaxID=2646786 RepID=UPI00286409F7|nr:MULTISPECIES: type II toxin-antitoxin system VapC family toxin [unclassified Caballeronia]MDR5738925.1 type II toxin-antitoxin system VapC family toxin [Caballeronia sp. LZ016]MDR5807413.1 type II toxin-antitoxin system VapC family toxin [Caballeronia sp. LZ019]
MIVLDTHALLWWIEGKGLSKPARVAIDREMKEEGEIAVSTMTAWEIMLLIKKGRLRLATDVAIWLDKVSRIEAVRFVPVDRHIAIASADLPGNFHQDPADRMIVATARFLSAPLLTKDEQIRTYEHVRTIW